MRRKREVLVVLGWYDPRYLEGVGRFAREANWHLATRSLIEASTPRGWKGDGLLVNDTEVPRLRRFIRSQIRQQPTVVMGSHHRVVSVPSVAEDTIGCGRAAAEHFLDRGYRHFAWFSIARGRVEEERREGFVRTLEAAGETCTLLEWDKARGPRRDTWANCRRWFAAQLARLPKPLAIFALDDPLAVDVIEVCMDSGLRVPEDVGVMGVGNMEMACECSRIPVSSVDVDMTRIAYEAAALLQRLMDDEPEPGEPMVVPLKGVVMRASTDTLAVTHTGLARAVAFMTESFSQNIGVDDVARAAGMSRRALHHIFQTELRRTPARHLLRVRLDHARQMLKETGKKISEIAEDCGFLSARNLHRCFVRELGVSPREYVKKEQDIR